MANKGKVRLSPRADKDLEAIHDYSVRRWGSKKAALYILSLDNTFRFLAANPSAGQDYGFVKEGLRAFPHDAHLVFYRQNSRGITITRLLHKSMAIERHL